MKKRVFLAAGVLALSLMSGCGKTEDSGLSSPISEEITEDLPAGDADGNGQDAASGENASEDGSEESGQGTAQGGAASPNGASEGAGQNGESGGPAESGGVQTEGETNSKDTGSEFSFAELSGWEFYFSSGAGGWYTDVSINSDGSFEGHFQDSDMGDTGDGYPGGTLYISDFTGRFDKPEKVDDFTYKMKMSSLTIKDRPEKEIIDDVLYVRSTAYGLDGGEEFYLYLPGAKIADLPEEYRQWVGYYNMESMKETELSFYGLYNIKEGNGFSSNKYEQQSLAERIAAEISYAEEIDAQLQEEGQAALTQMDMNINAAQTLENWDNTLNIVWKLLMSELDEETAKALQKEEREWIAEKDAQVKEAGKECEGGSIQPAIEGSVAAELTRERVYELAEYAK